MALVLACGIAISACGRPPGNLSPEFDGATALDLVRQQVDFGPRTPGSPGHAQIQPWIEDGLDRSGWLIVRQTFTFADVPLLNLIGRLEGGTGPLVVLGAHYDTRPHADRDPVDPLAPVPGANDGASGVAVLLELGRVLPAEGLACDLRLAFFDAEDSGRIEGWDWSLGASHFAEQLEPRPAAVVVDMVGDEDLRVLRERNSTPDLVDSIWAAASQSGNEAFVDEPGPALIDDHIPFLERGWPAVDIIDFTYPYWHTTEDTVDKVSAESLQQVGRTLVTWLGSFCGKTTEG